MDIRKNVQPLTILGWRLTRQESKLLYDSSSPL